MMKTFVPSEVVGAIAIFIMILIVYEACYMYIGGRLTGSPWGSLIAISMVVGESILRTALAVTATKPCDTDEITLPLSFGWLSHAVTSLLPVLAGGRGLIPEPEIDCQIVNMESGKSRQNKSWMLARMVRDLEKEANDSIGGLNISVYDAGKMSKQAAGRSSLHTVTKFTMWVQSIVLIVELFRNCHSKEQYQDSKLIFLLVFLGVFLRLLTTQLFAWHAEKFTARPDGGDKSVYALTRGDGHRHVFIIRNCHDETLNLEDLAIASTVDYDWFGTGDGYILIGTTVGWLIFTVVACHLTHGAGLLFGLMALGSVSNIITAAYPVNIFRRIVQTINSLPGANKQNHLIIDTPYPMDLTLRESWSHGNVMEALKRLETKVPGYGEKLLKTFFPTRLSPEDELFWADAKAAINRKHARQPEEAKDGNNRVQTEAVVELMEFDEAMKDTATPTTSSAFLVAEKQGNVQKMVEEDDDNEAKNKKDQDERRVIEGEGTGPKKAYLKSRRRG